MLAGQVGEYHFGIMGDNINCFEGGLQEKRSIGGDFLSVGDEMPGVFEGHRRG